LPLAQRARATLWFRHGTDADRCGDNGGCNVVSTKQLVWRELGACRGLDPSMFYPDDDEVCDEAKSVCAGCHVRVACLEYALQHREKQGIWGGATERERRRIIRQRRRTA
jgi:WhiB family transcriptional regulator, redox-sensing transcriptional regulator